ncbi:hypothetical protein LSAT2_019487 [Lamellibrachia satsuma]|nr:hypothetical protein LSAT2_019487 [Lamellibrachia satsuma]
MVFLFVSVDNSMTSFERSRKEEKTTRNRFKPDVGLHINVKSRRIWDTKYWKLMLYEQLRPFFVHLVDESMDTASITPPYSSREKTGAISTLSLPVFYRHKFIGVVGMDMTMDDYTISSKNSLSSYYFMVDRRNGMTMYHPTLPYPMDSDDLPVMVNIAMLETYAYREGIIASILRGKSGQKQITTSLFITPGGVVLRRRGRDDDERDLRVAAGLSIKDLECSICFVFGARDDDEDIWYRQTRQLDVNYIYHNFIRNKNIQKCSYIERVASLEYSVVMFPSTAFLDPTDYFAAKETSDRIGLYDDIIKHRRKNDLFKHGVENAVKMTSGVEDKWKSSASSDTPYSVWQIVAVPDKALRIFPGVHISMAYLAQSRMWYRKAMAQPGRIVMGRPSLDELGSGFLTSISQTIMVPLTRQPGDVKQKDAVFGVISVDVALEFMYAKLVRVYPVCKQDNIECSLIDSSGYIISHKQFEEPMRRKRDLPSIYDIHITRMYGTIAADLIARGFMNKTHCLHLLQYIQFFTYKLHNDLAISDKDPVAKQIGYQMHHIKDSNVFVLWKMKSTNASNKNMESCVCSFWKASTPPECLKKPSTRCECPCYRYYSSQVHCSNGTTMGNETRICAPISRTLSSYASLIKTEKSLRNSVKSCFNRKCHNALEKGQRTLKSLDIMSPLGTMFVQEGVKRRVSWRQAVRAELVAVSISIQVERYPMFARFVGVVSVAHEGDQRLSS